MKLAVLALTKGGTLLAEQIVSQLENCTLLAKTSGITATFQQNWEHFDGFICIMATGIVVRAIAPLIQDKRHDPCIVILDEKGNHVISLLSGHLGGGNQLAYKIAGITNGTAVITTASDTLGLVALDLWVQSQNLTAADTEALTRASGKLVNTGSLQLYCETQVEDLPVGIISTDDPKEADICITNRNIYHGIATFHPRNLVVGIGCNRNTPTAEFEEALTELFSDLQLSPLSIRNFASIDVKNDEEGLIQFASNHNVPIEFFAKDQINTITNVDVSDAALKAVGAIGVAEPTALLSANTTILLSRKRKWHNITMAIAEAPFTLSAQAQDQLNI